MIPGLSSGSGNVYGNVAASWAASWSGAATGAATAPASTPGSILTPSQIAQQKLKAAALASKASAPQHPDIYRADEDDDEYSPELHIDEGEAEGTNTTPPIDDDIYEPELPAEADEDHSYPVDNGNEDDDMYDPDAYAPEENISADVSPRSFDTDGRVSDFEPATGANPMPTSGGALDSDNLVSKPSAAQDDVLQPVSRPVPQQMSFVIDVSSDEEEDSHPAQNDRLYELPSTSNSSKVLSLNGTPVNGSVKQGKQVAELDRDIDQLKRKIAEMEARKSTSSSGTPISQQQQKQAPPSLPLPSFTTRPPPAIPQIGLSKIKKPQPASKKAKKKTLARKRAAKKLPIVEAMLAKKVARLQSVNLEAMKLLKEIEDAQREKLRLEQETKEEADDSDSAEENDGGIPKIMVFDTVHNPTYPDAFVPYESIYKGNAYYCFHPSFDGDVATTLRSLTYSNNIDPNWAFCTDDLDDGGCSKGTDCEWQHLSNIGIGEDKILVALGNSNGLGHADRRRFIDGLRQVLIDIKVRDVKDFDLISKAILDYRRNFLGDASKIRFMDVDI
ncbi:hypothetical protein CFO_g4076 [Ceratocystis platani]|uniref:C3H1-type domain-containing protein n=1 Tax=Ceratocystis fimbriata f. sp. platani TaxID=88771 RepID=A0A0F8CS84_CERFI|nr:hypothetical protein CFO_g4076 [Ceratocystis platani]